MERYGEEWMEHIRRHYEMEREAIDRMGQAHCRLNGYEWDDVAGPKPEGFDDLPDFSLDGEHPTKHDYIQPAMKRIEEIIGKAEISRCLWKYELGATEDEWFRWYVCKRLDELASREISETEKARNELNPSEIVLHEKTGDKADQTKECIQPELNPGTARIFTPSFVRGLFLRLLFSFALGLFLSFALKLITVLCRKSY